MSPRQLLRQMVWLVSALWTSLLTCYRSLVCVCDNYTNFCDSGLEY